MRIVSCAGDGARRLSTRWTPWDGLCPVVAEATSVAPTLGAPATSAAVHGRADGNPSVIPSAWFRYIAIPRVGSGLTIALPRDLDHRHAIRSDDGALLRSLRRRSERRRRDRSCASDRRGASVCADLIHS
jgi:hypothetical protein